MLTEGLARLSRDKWSRCSSSCARGKTGVDRSINNSSGSNNSINTKVDLSRSEMVERGNVRMTRLMERSVLAKTLTGAGGTLTTEEGEKEATEDVHKKLKI
jgi:hypothetical protein